MTTLNLQVGATADDGHEYPQDTWNPLIFWFGHYGSSDEWGVTRFQNVTIAKGSTINSANYTLYERADEGGDYTVNVKIRAQATDDAAAPGAANLPSDWSYTTAGVDLDIASLNWTDGETTVVSITAVIQEIVNRAGWVSGNDINVVVLNDGTTGDHDLEAYDYSIDTSKAAKLDIDYTAPAAGPSIPVVMYHRRQQGIS